MIPYNYDPGDTGSSNPFLTLGDLPFGPPSAPTSQLLQAPPRPQAPQQTEPTWRQKFHALQAGQNPYEVQSAIEGRRQQQAAIQAQTEANLFKAIKATEPGQRKPLLGILQRFYNSAGIQPEQGVFDFLKNAEAADLDLLQYITRQKAEAMGVPESEYSKFLLTSPGGFAGALAELGELRKELAQTEKLKAETRSKDVESKLLEGAMGRLSEAPTIDSEAPMGPGPGPMPQRAPGGSQGPSMRPAALGTPEGQAIQKFVVNRAQALGVDPALAQALIHQESGWNPQAKSPTGVQGLAQVTNATGSPYGQTPQTRSNPYVSANTGLTHFADLLKQTGNEDEALKRYNGGSDPQYVQNVRRHLPLYRTSSMAVAEGANEQERSAIQHHKSQIAEIQGRIQRLGPAAAASPKVKAMIDEWRQDIKLHQDEIKRIEDRYDKNKPDEDTLGAFREMFGSKPWSSGTEQERQAAIQYGPTWKARKGAEISRTELEATLPLKKELARAGREGQPVKDVTEYEDEQGNPPPVGLSYDDLKESGKYRQVKHLSDKQIEESETRREFILSLRDLVQNHKAITTGPVEGRLERWRQALGGQVTDEQVAQRLLLEKINNDAAFLRGGKALTINEIRRIQAELPQDIDPPQVFQAKLSKALQIAERYARNRTKDLKALGYKVPLSLGIDEETQGDPEVAEFINLLKQGKK